MKKAFISSLLALGLVACNTPYDHTPNPGGLGEYGFTYDLGGTPSPFIDTSYRPLTPAELAAPTIVVVTNYRTPAVVYKEAPEIGITKYAGSTPASVYSSGAAPIVEAAGANRTGANAGVTATGATPGTAGYAPGGYYYGGDGGTVVGPITNVTQTVTNGVNTNNLVKGTNGIVINNTNGINLSITNTNAFAGGTNISTNTDLASTNQAINEAAGAQSTNRFGEPMVPTAPPQATPLQQTPLQQQQLQQQLQIQRQQQLQQLQQQAIQRQQQAVQQSQSAAPPAAPNAGQTSGNTPSTSGQNASGNQNSGTSGTSGSSGSPSGTTGSGGGAGGQAPH